MKSKGLPLSKAAKIAWREGRASAFKFTFVVLAVAVGVGALTGVRGFSRAFQSLLLREARTLMAADVAVRNFMLPTPEQTRVMDDIVRQGADSTWVTEVISMAAASPDRPPTLVGVKAVDPKKYPFYGHVRLDPPADFLHMDRESVAVSDDLLMRLYVQVGDTIRLGGQPFRIIAVLAEEPDRMVGNLNIGPRVMMTREGLERAGLMQPGSRAAERFLFRLPPTANVERITADLRKAFPESQVTDFREAHPILSQGLNQATSFLSLVSLISLIVGSLGVATAINAHLQQRLDSIAIMKCVGARSSQITRIYLIQTLALGLIGGLIGILIGFGVQATAPLVIEKFFAVRPAFSLDWRAPAEGLAIGLLTSLLFSAPPLLKIRQIRPGLIFRREMVEVKPKWRERIRRGWPSIIAGAILVLAVGAIAASLTSGSPNDRIRIGEYFVGGLVVCLAVLSAIAWILLRILRFVSRKIGRAPAPLRHGVANLYRPGNHAEAVVVSLGVGVMFTLAVYLIQRDLLAHLSAISPPGMANVFILDVAAKNATGVVEFVRQQKGIESPPVLLGTVAAKLNSIDGTPLGQRDLKGIARRFTATRQVTSEAARPAYAEVTQGAWWSGRPATPQVCAGEDAAKILKLAPGSRMEWTIANRVVTSELACIVRIDSAHLMGRLDFIFNPDALAGAPVIYYGTVRVKPENASELQVNMYRRFPMVTVINIADVLRLVQQVVNQITFEVQLISVFTILAGVSVLASIVAGTRFRRIREVVILKTLGATRAKIATVFSIEFLILGAVAGLMGSALASGFSALVLKNVMKATVHFDLSAHAISITATALVAVGAGWIASFRILGQKPLQVLRDE